MEPPPRLSSKACADYRPDLILLVLWARIESRFRLFEGSAGQGRQDPNGLFIRTPARGSTLRHVQQHQQEGEAHEVPVCVEINREFSKLFLRKRLRDSASPSREVAQDPVTVGSDL
jgi:hypothetical protein